MAEEGEPEGPETLARGEIGDSGAWFSNWTDLGSTGSSSIGRRLPLCGQSGEAGFSGRGESVLNSPHFVWRNWMCWILWWRGAAGGEGGGVMGAWVDIVLWGLWEGGGRVCCRSVLL